MTAPVPVRPVSQVGGAPGRQRDGLRVLVAVCLGTTMIFFQITAAASALGAIQEDLHVSPAALIWIPSAYTLAVAGLVLSAGTLGSRHGRWRLFRLGVLTMIAGSLTSVAAASTGMVVVGQLVTGVGGALILPNSLAILSTTFPDPHRRTEAITAWAAASGIGLVVGPLAAGELLAHLGWHAAFASTPVLGVLTLAVTVRRPREAAPPSGRLDLAGQLVAVVSISALVCALIEGGQAGYGSPAVLGLWAVAAVGTVAFVLVERRSGVPMLDLRLFSSRSFTALLLVGTVLLFGFSGVTVLSVLFYERVQHLGALDAGWRMLPVFGVYVVVAYATGRIVRRTGFTAPLVAGLVLGGVAALGLVTQDPGTPYSSVWPLLAAFGAACGLVAPPSTAAALASVPAAQAGMASGAVTMFRQVGSVVGSSLLGSLMTSRLIAALPGRLAAQHVPAGARDAVQHAVAAGSPPPGGAGHAVTTAIELALTSGVHAGLAVTGVVFLATAVLVVAVGRNRPELSAARGARIASPGRGGRRARRGPRPARPAVAGRTPGPAGLRDPAGSGVRVQRVPLGHSSGTSAGCGPAHAMSCRSRTVSSGTQPSLRG
jgi:MFS family permease